MNKMNWNENSFLPFLLNSIQSPKSPPSKQAVWKAEKVLGWTPKDEFGGEENFNWEACWTSYPSTSYVGYDEKVKAKCMFRSNSVQSLSSLSPSVLVQSSHSGIVSVRNKDKY